MLVPNTCTYAVMLTLTMMMWNTNKTMMTTMMMVMVMKAMVLIDACQRHSVHGRNAASPEGSQAWG